MRSTKHFHDSRRSFIGSKASYSQAKVPKNATGVRIAVTQSSGIEQEQVVHFTSDEGQRAFRLERRFENLLASDNRLALPAASRAIWKSLQNGGESRDE